MANNKPEVKKTDGVTLAPEESQGNDPVQPAAQESTIADKLAQLEEALKKTNEINAQLEAQSRAMDEKMKNMQPVATASAADKANAAVLHKAKATRMKENLAKQPKVKVFVPLEGKEKKGTQLPVTLNGYRVNVPKGLYVEVPEQVGQVIMESLNQTQEATDIPQNLDNMDDAIKQRVF